MKRDRFIYFIRPVGMAGPIKIGCSGVPLNRLEELAVWSPYPLEVIWTGPGNISLEQNIHDCFADLHSHREWFHPGARLLETISKLLAGAAIEEAVDLGNRIGSIRGDGRRGWSPERRLYVSLASRVRYACERPAKTGGESVCTPDDVGRALNAFSGWGDTTLRFPTDAERAVIEQFIADPVTYGVPHSVKYPKKAAA